MLIWKNMKYWWQNSQICHLRIERSSSTCVINMRHQHASPTFGSQNLIHNNIFFNIFRFHKIMTLRCESTWSIIIWNSQRKTILIFGNDRCDGGSNQLTLARETRDPNAGTNPNAGPSPSAFTDKIRSAAFVYHLYMFLCFGFSPGNALGDGPKNSRIRPLS